MSENAKRPLEHDPRLGEVDPRTYPLICKVHLGCEKIGSHERVLQLNRLGRVLDRMFTDAGEPQCRLHFTAEPGVDAKRSIEVRAQCLTCRTDKKELEMVAKVQEQIDSIRTSGESMGWTLIES